MKIFIAPIVLKLQKKWLMHIRKAIAKNTIVLKLFVTYLMLTLILSFSIIMIFNIVSSKLVKQRICDSFSFLLEYVCEDVYVEYTQLLHLSDYIFVNRDIKEALEMGNEASLEKRQLSTDVRSAISEYTNSNYLTDINHIIISDLDGIYKLYFYMNSTDILKNAFDDNSSEYINAAQKASGALTYYGMAEWSVLPDKKDSLERNELIFCRSIKDQRYKTDIGIMYFAINPQLFTNRMQNYDGGNQELAKQAKLLLVDSSGNIVNDSGNLFSKDELVQILSSSKAASSQGLVMQKHNQIVFKRETFMGWYVIGSIPNSFVDTSTNTTIYLSILAIILCNIICMMLGFLSFRSIFLPIHQIGLKMQKIASGDKYLRINVKSEDEIGQLGTHLNKMLDQIDTLNNENLHKELQMHDAMHFARQMQINPHFILNTLNGIRWMAIMQNANSIKNAVDTLWKIIKYNTSSPNKYYVRVRDEIDILRQYIALQRLSYVDKFTVEWDIDERLLDYKCIKFSLQPIIENSIIHGTNGKEKAITIYVRCYRENSLLVFNIFDTGTGIPPKILENLTKNTSTHIGLQNVRERLVYLYGENFTFNISSELDKYTNIIIKTPLEQYVDPEEMVKCEGI